MDETDVGRAIADYYVAFSTLDVQGIVRHFQLPALMMGASATAAVPDAAALVAIFGPTMEGLRARGYGRSQFELHRVKLMSESAALAAGIAVRYKTDGSELERVGITYVLQRTSAGWKIAVIILDTDGEI